MTHRILCRVSGGPTGTREAYLRERGELVTFDNYDAAWVYARLLTKRQNAVEFRTADYSYTVESFD